MGLLAALLGSHILLQWVCRNLPGQQPVCVYVCALAGHRPWALGAGRNARSTEQCGQAALGSPQHATTAAGWRCDFSGTPRKQRSAIGKPVVVTLFSQNPADSLASPTSSKLGFLPYESLEELAGRAAPGHGQAAHSHNDPRHRHNTKLESVSLALPQQCAIVGVCIVVCC